MKKISPRKKSWIIAISGAVVAIVGILIASQLVNISYNTRTEQRYGLLVIVLVILPGAVVGIYGANRLIYPKEIDAAPD